MTLAATPIQRSYDSGFQTAKPKELADGAFGMQNRDSQYALVAFAGGDQTSATQLIPGGNEVVTAASTSDSVKLPANSAGTMVFLANNGAQTIKIFAKEATGTVPTIDGTAGTTGVNLVAAKNMLLMNVGNNKWESITSA